MRRIRGIGSDKDRHVSGEPVTAPDLAAFQEEISERGYALFPGLVAPDLLAALRRDIPGRIRVCREWQLKNGVADGMDGAAHHVVGGDDSLSQFLSRMYLDQEIRAYFGGEYILNSYGAINNLGVGASVGYKHGQRFHRDVRTYSGSFRLMLNMLVMVDAFTAANGATRLVPGSHRDENRPDESELEARAVQAVAGAGSILLFDSNLWHSAAPNLDGSPRMALTLTFSRPFFKQQMDYPRMLGEDYTRDERLRQVLGYNSRTPNGYDEWYQPPERRMYKPGQG